MSKLSVSDLIVFLIISELMTMSIGNKDVNFLQAALAVFVIVIMDKLFTVISLKNPFFKKIVEGHPTFIIFQGKVNQKKMASLKYSVDDLCHHLREQGICLLYTSRSNCHNFRFIRSQCSRRNFYNRWNIWNRSIEW